MIGQRLGAYTIRSELGSGGMGTVYLAEDRSGRQVALKIVHPHLLESPGFFKRFLREAEIGKRVEHANVVRTLDVDAMAVGGTQHNFLVMEYVPGQTLRAMLRDIGRVPEKLCWHIGREVSKALRAIHEAGVVHRDLKPENVLITEEHEVKVMDLGIAALQDETLKLSLAGDFVGSVLYAAPEQFRGTTSDRRADYYALGLILYELATGKLPGHSDHFAGVMEARLNEKPRPASELNPQLSAFFEEVLKSLLVREPDLRLTTVESVLEEGEEGSWWRTRAKAIRAETKRPLRRIRIPRETALYGRDAELARLSELYQRAANGQAQVMLIGGEAGIGKTRLIDEFVARLRSDGEDLNFLFGSYPPGGAATAAGAVSTAYREHFGEEAIEETLADYLTVTPLLIPAFAALLRGDTPPPGAEPLTKDSLLTVFVHATRRLASERPTIVLLDDLHFAPEEGLGVFAALALGVLDHRVLLIGTHRPRLSEDWVASLERQEHATRLTLARLGPKDLGRMLVDVFQSKRLAEELSLKIATKSDGNPFFVFEIIRGLREGQFITRQEDGTWARTQVIGYIEIPSSVLDLIKARMVDLKDDERHLLDVASCCGFEFDPILVGEALGLKRIPLLQRLASIENRHGLVRSAGMQFVFDHHQVREALYERMSPLLRREYHAALGEAMLRLDENPDGNASVELCEHLFKGERGDAALPHLTAAIEHLQQGHLNGEVDRLARRALEVPGLVKGKTRADLLLRRAESLNMLGRRPEQKAALDEALALAPDWKLGARARLGLGTFHWMVAEYEEAEAVLTSLLTEACETGDRETEQGALRILGVVTSGRGRYDDAREYFRRARELAQELDDKESLAAATIDYGVFQQRLGRWQKSRDYLLKGLDLALDVGSHRCEQNARGNLHVVYHHLREFDKALECSRLCLALAREIGDRRVEAKLIGLEGLLHGDLGRHEQAIQSCRTWLRISKEIQDRHGEAYAMNGLGFATERSGNDRDAVELYEKSLALAHEIGDPLAESYPAANLGCVFWRRGRYASARTYWERFHELAAHIGNRESEVNAAANLALLYLALGDVDRAQSYLDEAQDPDRPKAPPSAEGHAVRVRARVLQRAGRHDEAVGLLEDALRLAADGDERHLEGDICMALADALGDAGRDEDSVVRIREALALARDSELGHRVTRAEARLALAEGDKPQVALEHLENYPDAFGPASAMDIRFELWKSTGAPEHLREAHRILGEIREHAPEEYRDSMMRVPIHHEIADAWAQHS